MFAYVGLPQNLKDLKVRESIYAFGSRLALQCRGSCRGDKGWFCWGVLLKPVGPRSHTHRTQVSRNNSKSIISDFELRISRIERTHRLVPRWPIKNPLKGVHCHETRALLSAGGGGSLILQTTDVPHCGDPLIAISCYYCPLRLAFRSLRF